MTRCDAEIVYQLVHHPDANADLDRIAEYIAYVRHEPLNAARFLRDFRRDVLRLERLPSSYAPVSDHPPRPVYCRTFKRSYLVYHEVFEAERIVRILYVWDGRRHERPDLRRQQDTLEP